MSLREGSTKLRARLVVTLEYDAPHRDYDTDDPEKLMAIDRESFDETPDLLWANPDATFELSLEVVGS